MDLAIKRLKTFKSYETESVVVNNSVWNEWRSTKNKVGIWEYECRKQRTWVHDRLW